MYRIRIHGRGGQGIKSASRILGTAFFLEGFEVQDAPRYGAERRGAPIFAYVRAAQRPIAERGVIRHPDLVIVADDSLIPVPAAGVLSGLDAHSVLLVNTHDTADTWRHRLNLQNPLFILPAAEETADRADLPFVSAACAGAAAGLLGVIGKDALERAIRQDLAYLGEAIVAKNLLQALDAFDRMADHQGYVRPAEEGPPSDWPPPQWVDLPFEPARISAPVIRGGPTSAVVKTGVWRTMRPVIDPARCKGCWWVCSTFCPDSAIEVDETGRPQIDYDHCKGCLICVAQCPPHAIAAIPEHEAQATEHEGGNA